MKYIIALILVFASFENFAQSKLFNNEDSVFYNSIGIGISGEAVDIKDKSVAGFGLNVNLEYLINERVFSKIQARNMQDGATFGIPYKMQAYNFQLGIKGRGQVVDPFILSGVEFNNLTHAVDPLSWQTINTQIGLKAKIGLFNSLKLTSSVSLQGGLIHLEGEYDIMYRINFDFDAIFFNKWKVFWAIGGGGSNANNVYINNYSSFNFSVGLKYVY